MTPELYVIITTDASGKWTNEAQNPFCLWNMVNQIGQSCYEVRHKWESVEAKAGTIAVENDNQGSKTHVKFAVALYSTEVNVEFLHQKQKYMYGSVSGKTCSGQNWCASIYGRRSKTKKQNPAVPVQATSNYTGRLCRKLSPAELTENLCSPWASICGAGNKNYGIDLTEGFISKI